MIRALTLSACTLLATAPLPAHAQAGIDGQAPSHQPGPMARKLNLSPDQQAKIQAIRQRQRADRQARMPDVKAKHQAFRAALKDPKSSEADLRRTFDAMTESRFQMLMARRQARQDMRAVLTPEQRTQADAMHEQFRSRMRARMRERLEHRLQEMDEANR